MPQTPNPSEKTSVLKSTREARGLTLEIVHEATKIPMDALKAIEEGYSVRILSPFYYKGFVKIYAEFLGLDPKDMYAQYGLDNASKAAGSVAQVVNKIKRPAPVPNIAFEQWQEWAGSFLNAKTFFNLLKVGIFLLLVFFMIRIAGCVVSHWPKKNKSAVTMALKAAEEKRLRLNSNQTNNKPQEAPQEKPQRPIPQEQKPEAVNIVRQSDKVEVAVRAMKNTWLQVKADDKVVFQMTLSKGSMESWSADNHIQISGRNLETLDMEVNGKHIGTLGGGERRIRRVWITPQGLTVKK